MATPDLSRLAGPSTWVALISLVLSGIALGLFFGGAGSFWGPVVGSVAYALITYWTRTFVGLSEIIVGGTLVLVIIAAPTGIVGLLHAAQARLARGAKL
jgi:branched-chain amino acid transport system permease protein